MSLLHSLPAPQQALPEREAEVEVQTLATTGPFEPPPYLRRTEFIPRKESDFGNGGAFPEIPVAQYPLGMGREKEVAKTLAVTVNADGEVNYDAVVKQGQNRDKTVFSKHSDLVPKVDELNKLGESKGEAVDDEEMQETARDTWEHLQRVVDKKIQVANPKTIGPKAGPAQLIKYTPSQQGNRFNSGCSQRIVKLHDMPQDPLDPPKFRHVRVPKGPGDPPVPILHSPPRKVTYQDQQDWKIPPCISNWKNQKGYTIPLDKRLAADGRGLQETTVSEKFAAFTESLYSAEHKAREALHMRNKVQRELMAREKEKKEKELRELAQKARMEHGGIPLSARVDAAVPVTSPTEEPESPGSDSDKDARRRRSRSEKSDLRRDSGLSAEETAEKKRRDEIREERRRERERERRLEARDAKGSKKSKITRDRERDISEKIALGMAKVDTSTGEAMYDSRLFNQDRGMSTGFGAEDGYHVYDKPLFIDRGSSLYKPKPMKDEEVYEAEEGDGAQTGKFRADTGFKGAEEPVDAARTGPVEFDADPFGLDDVVEDKRGNALEQLGRRGGMNAAAGGSAYADAKQGSSRTRIRFQEGRD